MSRTKAPARDDFSPRTKTTIARRQHHYCAICGCATSGPAQNPLEAKNIGEAAHIKAAARGGARYDESQTKEERTSVENGIWCCRNCGKEVDDDESKFTKEELRERRRLAVERADERFGIRAERGPDLAQAEAAARIAAGAILRQWQQTFRFNHHQLVELELREHIARADSVSTPAMWPLAKAVEALSDGRALVLIGRPGAGKTVTLLQAAEKLLAVTTAPIPLVFSVSGWLASVRDLSQYVAEQLIGFGVVAAGVPLLFKTGRLALLLNGWNEAAETDQTRANALLRDFLLNHPGTPLAIATRETRTRPVVPGGTLMDVRPLSAAKKVAVVRASGIAEPDRFLAELENNAVLAEVTDTPLFLAAALKLSQADRPIPTTRSGLLGSFIFELEQTDNHAEMLRAAPCQDFHRQYLAAIAAAMTKQARTSLSALTMHTVLAACSRTLAEGHHIGMASASPAIAESLVRHHALVLLPGADVTYAFVHQQFQEWFAAHWVEQRVRQLGQAPVATDLFAFQRDILNLPQWQEALGFTVENLTVSEESQLAAQLIRWMMPVDLIAAAELCHLGGLSVWTAIGPELGEVMRRWHDRETSVHRRCALIAMLATGVHDFADLYWPELEGGDQKLMQLCRLHEPFRTSSLGPDWQERVSRWPANQQAIFLGELSRSATREEIEYAAARAARGSDTVRIAALDLLVEQRAFSRIVAILTAGDFGEWPTAIYDQILLRMPSESVQLLAVILTEQLHNVDVPKARLGIISVLERAGDHSWIAAAQAEMDRALVSWRTTPVPAAVRGDRQTAHAAIELFASYAAMLQPVDGDWLATWLATNLGGNLLWEEPFIRHVESFPEPVLLTLAQTALVGPLMPFGTGERVRALTARGSIAVVTVVIDAYLAAFDAPDDDSMHDRRQTLQVALRELPMGMVIDGILAKTATLNQFIALKALVRVISGFSPVDTTLKKQVQQHQRDGLRMLTKRVSELVPNEDEARQLRPSLAVMLGALGHPDDVPLVAGWLAAETGRWEAHLQQLAEARRNKQIRPVRHYGTSYWNWYGGAFALFQCPAAEKLLSDQLNSPHFIGEAASALVEFSLVERSLPTLPSDPFGRVRVLAVAAPAPMDPRVRAIREGQALTFAIGEGQHKWSMLYPCGHLREWQCAIFGDGTLRKDNTLTPSVGPQRCGGSPLCICGNDRPA